MSHEQNDSTTPAKGFREWLVTNSAGSFAMGTPERLAERKYHGLLNVRSQQFLDPHQVLNEINEVITTPLGGFELGAFHYGSLIHPKGFQHLVSFSAGPVPRWEYALGTMKVSRTFRLHPSHPMVLLEYEVEGAPDGTSISLFPYFSCRRIHDLQFENAVLDGRQFADSQRVIFRFYKGFPEIFIECQEGDFVLNGFWNQRVAYPEEKKRGYPEHEDLFCPGAFRIDLKDKTRISLVAGINESGNGLPGWPEIAGDKAEHITGKSIKQRLSAAASAYVVEIKNQRSTIIAGYPWFGEWGRDTFIALPGLTLARGKYEVAAQIFETYAAQLKNGLVPNVLGRTPDESDGNSIDASLWFIRALQMYQSAAGPEAVKPFIATVFSLLKTMLRRKVRGIHVRPSGLLYASSFPRPLTWMDACVNGLPVTPRSPFAVDVNALFFNAIEFALDWAKRLEKYPFLEVWNPLRDKLSETFREAFWMEKEQYLADSHSGIDRDTCFRPNQLLAIALPYPLMTKHEAKLILDKVRASLLTPMGLRTLAPDHPDYQGHCVGTQAERDRAYHQGTVWPWLLGMYWDAVRYAEGVKVAEKEGQTLLAPFAEHLEEACIGQVSEIFDGEAPHVPRGAPAQAWSVAELLRIAANFSDVGGKRQAPKPRGT